MRILLEVPPNPHFPSALPPPAYTCTPLGCQDYNGIYPNTSTALGSAVGWGLAIFLAIVVFSLVFFGLKSIYDSLHPRRTRPMPYTEAYQHQFVRMRKMVIQRDGSRCQRCGRPVSGLDRHVHHIIPRSRGGTNDPANLITLCGYHHRRMHGR